MPAVVQFPSPASPVHSRTMPDESPGTNTAVTLRALLSSVSVPSAATSSPSTSPSQKENLWLASGTGVNVHVPSIGFHAVGAAEGSPLLTRILLSAAAEDEYVFVVAVVR